MWGYWFGGAINALPADVQPHLGFLPAPVMGPNRISVCLAGTGAWIPTVSKQKDLAWKFMEYFMGGQPSVDRATSGWGIPSLKSLFSKMPQTLSYQQEAFQVQQQELPYLKVLEFSPYISDDAFTSAFTAAIEPVVHGQRALDDGIKQLNTNVNTILVQGKQQVS
jgi:multiple sugar transport system substrate-binding protein